MLKSKKESYKMKLSKLIEILEINYDMWHVCIESEIGSEDDPEDYINVRAGYMTHMENRDY